MGFMDKAKKLAEQAQEKLDEVQGQVNKSSQGGGEAQRTSARYDQHGRPIEEGPPAGEAPPPAAEPAEPAAETAEQADASGATEPAPQPPSEGGTETNPDPFKPIQ